MLAVRPAGHLPDDRTSGRRRRGCGRRPSTGCSSRAERRLGGTPFVGVVAKAAAGRPSRLAAVRPTRAARNFVIGADLRSSVSRPFAGRAHPPTVGKGSGSGNPARCQCSPIWPARRPACSSQDCCPRTTGQQPDRRLERDPERPHPLTLAQLRQCRRTRHCRQPALLAGHRQRGQRAVRDARRGARARQPVRHPLPRRSSTSQRAPWHRRCGWAPAPSSRAFRLDEHQPVHPELGTGCATCRRDAAGGKPITQASRAPSATAVASTAPWSVTSRTWTSGTTDSRAGKHGRRQASDRPDRQMVPLRRSGGRQPPPREGAALVVPAPGTPRPAAVSRAPCCVALEQDHARADVPVRPAADSHSAATRGAERLPSRSRRSRRWRPPAADPSTSGSTSIGTAYGKTSRVRVYPAGATAAQTGAMRGDRSCA